MKVITREPNLFIMLLLLGILFVFGQCAFFYVHYSVSMLIDSLTASPLAQSLFTPLIMLPVLSFICWQLCAYFLMIVWAWFVANEIGALFRWSTLSIYFLGLSLWLTSCILLFTLNHYYYPDSFFARAMNQQDLLSRLNNGIALLALFICFYTSALAYINVLLLKPRHKKTGLLLLLIMVSITALQIYNQFFIHVPPAAANEKPNIIVIGLDSLRPDHISKASTPNLTNYLEGATVFTQSYTPLARTFPSWVSILTAKYPKHNSARINLAGAAPILNNMMLGRALQQAGYFSIYGTDESRFANIGKEYGFDRIIGPAGNAPIFIFGYFSDFPLVNLLSNIAVGKLLFPYNYANRAAEYAYEPENFMHLIRAGLVDRPANQPLFLAIHFCLSHWPFTWARDGQTENAILSDRYASSVAGVDKQFGELIAMLEHAGILKNSLVVVLSDHGVTVGLPHDRLLDKNNFVGNAKDLHLVSAYKLSAAPAISDDVRHDVTISTSYGQGTDIASPNQYKILLSFKRYGAAMPANNISERASTLDVAPTILDYLKLAPIAQADGISLLPFIYGNAKYSERPFFMETGDTIADMESDRIFIEKVFKKMINAYKLDTLTGKLYINPIANNQVIKNKQRGVLLGDWMLIRYPFQTQFVLKKDLNAVDRYTVEGVSIPPYYLLANSKTGKWTIGLKDEFATHAPVTSLMSALREFYGQELD